MDNNSKPTDQYEERVRSLLCKLGFIKVKGGNNFLIGDNQIDACGICDNKLVIIECTTQRQTIRSKIETWKGKQASIRRGLDQIEDYRHFNNNSSLRFVLASKYSTVKQYEDIAKTGSSKVYLWGPETIYYYEKIAKAISSRAKYDVLADLEFELHTNEAMSIPAFKVTYKDVEMYSFFISPSELTKVSFVARRESGKKDFYQRMIDPSRLSKISKFLERGGLFPTNIVVGMNKKSSFQNIKLPSSETFPDWLSFGILTFPKSYQSCWIIDGQHRLFSFQQGMSQKISVLAFGNIDLTRQTRFFVEVNKEAKPISSMLIWDLVGDLTPQGEEGIISNAVKYTNTLLPFKGRISIPSMGSGKISLASFCDSLFKNSFSRKEIKTGKGELFTKNPFFDTDYKIYSKNIGDSISLLFGKVEDLTRELPHINNFIFDNGGVSVFIHLYKIIICLEGKKINNQIFAKYFEPVIEYLKTLGTSTIDEYRRNCSSEGGKRQVLNILLKLLYDVNPGINDYISERVDLLDELIDLEVKLRNIIEIEFKHGDYQQLKKRLSHSFVEQIEASIRRRSNDEIHDFCNQLSLGQSQTMIRDALWKDIFKHVFLRPDNIRPDINDLRFPNEFIFKAQLDQVARMRNDLVHGTGVTPTIKDKETTISFIEQVKTIISSYYKI